MRMLHIIDGVERVQFSYGFLLNHLGLVINLLCEGGRFCGNLLDLGMRVCEGLGVIEGPLMIGRIESECNLRNHFKDEDFGLCMVEHRKDLP